MRDLFARLTLEKKENNLQKRKLSPFLKTKKNTLALSKEKEKYSPHKDKEKCSLAKKCSPAFSLSKRQRKIWPPHSKSLKKSTLAFAFEKKKKILTYYSRFHTQEKEKYSRLKRPTHCHS